jgi:hypothetical protein
MEPVMRLGGALILADPMAQHIEHQIVDIVSNGGVGQRLHSQTGPRA